MSDEVSTKRVGEPLAGLRDRRLRKGSEAWKRAKARAKYARRKERDPDGVRELWRRRAAKRKEEKERAMQENAIKERAMQDNAEKVEVGPLPGTGGESGEVELVVIRVGPNPRVLQCGYRYEGGVKVLVWVKRNRNFRAGMRLKVPRQEGRDWRYEGSEPRFLGRW